MEGCTNKIERRTNKGIVSDFVTEALLIICLLSESPAGWLGEGQEKSVEQAAQGKQGKDTSWK